MNLTSQLTEFQNESRDLPVNERAELACQLAKHFEKVGEYEAAYEALRLYWPARDKAPKLDNLDDLTKGDVLLRVGALAGWFGAANQTEGAKRSQRISSLKPSRSLKAWGRFVEWPKDEVICHFVTGGKAHTMRRALSWQLQSKFCQLKTLSYRQFFSFALALWKCGHPDCTKPCDSITPQPLWWSRVKITLSKALSTWSSHSYLGDLL